MLVPKDNLLKPLKALQAFDPKGSPYIGVQMDTTTPQFYRSSANGYIQTKGFTGTSVTHVSLANFMDCLKSLPEDSVQLGVDNNGILSIYGTTSDIFESETHVHTVTAGQAGMKKHDTGVMRREIDKKAFLDINLRPFKTITPPVLAKGRLMLATDAGATVVWTGPDTLKDVPDVYPREAFLRMISDGANVQQITLTANAYWGAVIDDMVTFVKGHVLGRQIFDNYTTPGQEIAKLPAQRLIAGLEAAVRLLEPSERVDIDPRLGVLAKGKFGDNRNSLGETGDWPKFGVLAKTAKVIYEALYQAENDDYATLCTVPVAQAGITVLRLRRGAFEVNFRAY